jgi:AAA ATPase domain
MSTTAGLVGRATELATLRAALDAAVAGRGALVLVTGEPGIGKTTLLSETARVAADRGAHVLRGRCWDGDGSPPYWPWTHVLDGDLPAHGADRFTVFDTVARRLAALGQGQPLVVILDDLQWADPASLALLAFCVGQLRDEPVLFLGAHRDLDGPPLLASLAAAGTTLSLSGLDPSETGRLITLLGGEQRDVDIDRIWRRTSGNPFFVTELTRLRMAREFAGPIPAGIRDTVERRLARLSQPCAEMLAAAAVVGPVVPQWILVAVKPGVEHPELVREAIDARVLVAGADVEPLAFAHDLFREVLTAALPVAERARLHRTIATALDSGRGPASEIAAHWCAAAEAGDIDAVPDAVRHSVRAAAEASDRLADDDACAHYERALRVLQLGAPPPPDLPRVDLVLGWAAAQHRAGQGDQARANYRAAAEATRGDPERFAAAALGLHRLGAPRGRAHDELVTLLSQAAQALAGQRTRLRVQVLAALSAEEFHSWREPHLHRAAVLTDEAVALAHELDDPAVLASALHAQHDARWLPGSARVRREIAEEMLGLAVAGGEREAEGTARLLRATALVELGDPRGRSELAAYCALSAEIGHSRDRWGAMTRSATAALIAGDVEDAARLSADGVRYGLRIGEPDAHSVGACQAWDLDRFRGRAVDTPPGSGGPPGAARWPPWRAIALAESGDTAAARAAMAGVDIEQSWSAGVPIGPDPWGIAVMAEAAALAGTTDDRRRLLDALAPLAGTHIVAGGLATYAGPADFYRGLLSAALDQPGHATAHFRAALTAAERLGATRWTSLCTERLATLDTSTTGQGAFRKDGGVWTLTWAGTTVRLADAKGLADIATLLAHSGTAVPAVTLATGQPPTTGADPLLDTTALSAYRARLRRLDVELADAEHDNDLHRAERLHDERDALLHELCQAIAPGGRPRRLGSESERARKAVTGRIHDSIAHIAQVHPALAAHLGSAISTGTACRYEPGTPVHWTL